MFVLQTGDRIIFIGSGARAYATVNAIHSDTSAWYTVPGKTTVAAYQPKGAASLAASYVNLANPGTYDLTLQGSGLTWDTTNGWGTNWAPGRFLKTGITPAEGGWSLIVRYSSASGGYRVAVGNNMNTGYKFGIGDGGFNRGWFHNGGTLNNSGSVLTSGVFCVTNEPYIDGTDVGTLTGTPGTPATPITIGGAYASGTAVTNVWLGYIQAVAIYSDTLTAGEVATVSTAMAAL